MTYSEAIRAAREAVDSGDYALSNFHLYIAAGFANAEELVVIRSLIETNDEMNNQ